jgi:hypothetical protein
MLLNRRILPLIALLFAACGTPTAAPTPPTAEQSAVVAVQVSDPPTAEATPDAPPQLLAWVDVDASAGDPAGGQIALLERDGGINPLLPLTDDDFLVLPCGQTDVQVAFYVGGITGRLYLLTGTRLSDPVTTTHYLACFDGGTFQFSPDGTRFSYMDYNAGAFTKEYADGTLHLHDARTLSEIASFEDVIAYQLEDERAAYVRFYQNADGEGAEAAISVWDGAANRELLTLTPTGANCRFTSAALTLRGNLAALVLGQRCPNQGTDWQFYTLDLALRSATLALSGDSGGAYFPYARTNNVWLSPSGVYAYVTIPDGVTARTAGLIAVNLTDLTQQTIIERQILLPHHEDARRAQRLSPDGAWLALPITSPGNNRSALAVIELDNPTLPLRVELGANTVGGSAFTPDSVIYAEINPSGSGSLNALDLALGTPRRLTRGFFQNGLAITLDGQQVGAHLYAGDEPPYYSDLVGVTLDGALTTFYSGAPSSRATPLAWVIPLEPR